VPPEFEGVAGAVVRADRSQCPGKSGNAQLANSDADPEAVIARGNERRV